MKKLFKSVNQLKESKAGLSMFSEVEILSPEFMNRVRGGDNGDSDTLIPPIKN